MSRPAFDLDPVDDLIIRLSIRIGQIDANGVPWQRKDQRLHREARDMLRAIMQHVRTTGAGSES